MGEKGDLTKQLIKEKAWELFAEKGFKDVTMKDICEKTGLSRGGLYRHYESTATIFREIFSELSEDTIEEVDTQIFKQVEAKQILEGLLNQLKEEMLDANHSLSLAIYEYSNQVDHTFFQQLNETGRAKWSRLINYGIQSGSFNKVNVEQVIDIIAYAYQGVRMWSRVIQVSENAAEHIAQTVRDLLLR